ncbi:unnamed protein product [Euphydryas editha]|nr:unnamed protein product [Euphydryas editha]
MTKGCIQGSTCGPILCRIQAFADDVLLVASSRELANLQSITNQALHAIVSWGQGVKLTFSPTKTQAIAFGKKAKQASININSHTLHFQSDIKLLGVILDDKLLIRKHVLHVVKKASGIFHKLSLYCRPTWGAHPENILTIYHQVIQPIVTYAAGVWGHVARKKGIISKLLLSMQRGFALKAIKGFRTVSTIAAIALAQFVPLDLKVLEAHQIEKTRLAGHCTYLPSDITLEKYIPPDRLLHPAHRITFSPSSFHNESQIHDFISSHSTPITSIYTDGSKLDDDSVGAAFVCFDGGRRPVTKKYKLHNSCSFFQAELFAILQASRWASTQKFTHTLILSHSKAAIQASQNRSSTHPLVSRIHNTIHEHTQTGCIDFAWVKSHVGITGNETADTAAKSAALLHRAPDYACFPISYAKRIAKEASLAASRARYENAEQGQHTRDFLPTLDHIHTLFKTIKISFTLTQTLTGHAYNKHYLHRFHITEDDVCPCDGSSSQTLSHLLQLCPRFAAIRHDHEATCRHFGVSRYSLTDLVSCKPGIDSFVRLSDSIIRALKTFNST